MCVYVCMYLGEYYSILQIETRRGPEIYQLHIQTDITYRFATTQVICRLANKSPETKEAVFVMTIPKTAFINSFVM